MFFKSITFLSKGFKIIKKRSKILFIATALIYLISFSLGLGFGLFLRDREEARLILNMLARELSLILNLYVKGQFFLLGLSIFLYNLRTMFILSISGLLLIPTFIFVYLSASFSGLIIGIRLEEIVLGLYLHEVALLLVVFALEFVSLVLASTEGLYLGASIFLPKKIFKRKISRKKAFITTLKQTLLVYIIILLLLTIASITETTALYGLWKRGTGFIKI